MNQTLFYPPSRFDKKLATCVAITVNRVEADEKRASIRLPEVKAADFDLAEYGAQARAHRRRRCFGSERRDFSAALLAPDRRFAAAAPPDQHFARFNSNL